MSASFFVVYVLWQLMRTAENGQFDNLGRGVNGLGYHYFSGGTLSRFVQLLYSRGQGAWGPKE